MPTLPPGPPRLWSGPPRGYPARRPSSLPLIVLVLGGGVVLLLIVGLIGAAASTGQRSTASGYPFSTSGYPTSDPTSYDVASTTEGLPTVATTTVPFSPTAVPSPTPVRSPTSRTQPATPTPREPAGPKPVAKLGDNPLFSSAGTTSAVSCRLTRYVNTPAGSQALLSAALPCLDQAWVSVMERAGLPFRSPELAFPAGDNWSSPCGSTNKADDVAAFYCSSDETLYLPFSGLTPEVYGARAGAYLAVLAHEYGHHVQELSGVLDEENRQQFEVGPRSAAGLELSRRLELQAQCFSGLFFAAGAGRGDIDATVVDDAATTENRGDHTEGGPRTHGTDEHASGWWLQGLQRNSLAQCNTWLSDPADVS